MACAIAYIILTTTPKIVLELLAIIQLKISPFAQKSTLFL